MFAACHLIDMVSLSSIVVLYACLGTLCCWALPFAKLTGLMRVSSAHMLDFICGKEPTVGESGQLLGRSATEFLGLDNLRGYLGTRRVNYRIQERHVSHMSLRQSLLNHNAKKPSPSDLWPVLLEALQPMMHSTNSSNVQAFFPDSQAAPRRCTDSFAKLAPLRDVSIQLSCSH